MAPKKFEVPAPLIGLGSRPVAPDSPRLHDWLIGRLNGVRMMLLLSPVPDMRLPRWLAITREALF